MSGQNMPNVSNALHRIDGNGYYHNHDYCTERWPGEPAESWNAPCSTVDCDSCSTTVGRCDIGRVSVTGIETYACGVCRGER